MKKTIKAIACLALAVSMTGCATIFGGSVTDYQRTKPGSRRATKTS